MQTIEYVKVLDKNISVNYRGVASVLLKSGKLYFGDILHLDSKKVIVNDVRLDRKVVSINDIQNIIISGSEVTIIC